MLRISELHGLSPTAIGTIVQATGFLLGGRYDNLVVADSVEDYDLGVAIPVLDDNLVEQMFLHGVFAMGGGRFGFNYRIMIEAELAPPARGFKFALTKIVSLTVHYRGNEVFIPTFR